MSRRRAKEGTRISTLIWMALPICRAAQRQCPRTGPGKPPDYPDWQIAVLIMIAVLKKRKSKNAQYRWLYDHRRLLQPILGMKEFPSRSTYFDRYTRAYRLYEVAIRLQGQKLLQEGLADARTVAVDKSLLAARGPKWHKTDRRRNRIPKGLRGVDRDSAWAYSKHHGWVQGYSFEVVVTATKGSAVVPLSASADTASVSEHVSFGEKIAYLPEETKVVLGDTGYDNNTYGEAIEYDEEGRRTGRRFLCPPNPRNCRNGSPEAKTQRIEQIHRENRLAYYRSPRGQALYARRGQTVEPFNEWLKSRFDLSERVWHRGLGNNRTQLLAAIFGYQLLIRYNHRYGRKNGQLQWILDTL